MYLCARGNDFAPSYNYSIGFCNSSDILVFYFILFFLFNVNFKQIDTIKKKSLFLYIIILWLKTDIKYCSMCLSQVK